LIQLLPPVHKSEGLGLEIIGSETQRGSYQRLFIRKDRFGRRLDEKGDSLKNFDKHDSTKKEG
jgi:hypothetical protein